MAASNVPKVDMFHTTFMEMARLVARLLKTLHEREMSDLKPFLLDLGISFMEGYNKQDLINNFIHYSSPHWEKIRVPDPSYFEHDADIIFEPLKTKYGIKLEVIKTLYTAREADGRLVISEEEQAAVWSYFQTMVKIAHHYIYETRGPVIVTSASGERKVEFSKPAFFEKIDLLQQARLWKTKLVGITV